MDQECGNPCETPTTLRSLMAAALGESVGDVPDVPITGLADDSREVGPGGLFVAVAGHEADGHRFIADAVKRGAAAVVVEKPIDPIEGVAVVRVPNSRVAVARLASVFHGLDKLRDQGRIRVVAVTGTNGKSTFCYLAQAIANAAGDKCALLGTIEYDLIDRTIPAPVTTPGPVTLAGYVAQAARAGAQTVVFEASSHALHQHRTDGVRIDVGVFTNLSGDHLDYHGNLEEYLSAKKRLFDGLGSDATAVLNQDDPAGERVMADCEARRLTYGLNPLADVRARITDITADGSRFELITSEASVEVHTRLVGRHNVANCLAAATAGVALGIDPETIQRGLSSVERVAGRLERVAREGETDDPAVLVDYAHTDDALLNVLSALQPLKKNRLIVVFGCGGDRDRTKRPRMAKVAGQTADMVLVTSDNPRTEKPEAIIEEIMAGFESRDMGHVTIEPDRRAAIKRAIGGAGPDDVVLIAGKGHENYQVLGKERVPFDDRQVALDCLHGRGSSR